MNIFLGAQFPPVANRPQPVQLTNFLGRTVAVGADTAVPSADTSSGTPDAPAAPAKGFGLDLDGDGRVGGREDGFLAFKNADGSHDLARANRLLKAFSGQTDLDGDGTVSEAESSQAAALKEEASRMDLDQDGVLATWELQKAGARIITFKKDEDGKLVESVHDTVEPGSPEHQEQMEAQLIYFQMMQQQAAFQQMLAATYLQTFTSFQGAQAVWGGGFGGSGVGPGGYPAGLALPIY